MYKQRLFFNVILGGFPPSVSFVHKYSSGNKRPCLERSKVVHLGHRFWWGVKDQGPPRTEKKKKNDKKYWKNIIPPCIAQKMSCQLWSCEFCLNVENPHFREKFFFLPMKRWGVFIFGGWKITLVVCTPQVSKSRLIGGNAKILKILWCISTIPLRSLLLKIACGFKPPLV